MNIFSKAENYDGMSVETLSALLREKDKQIGLLNDNIAQMKKNIDHMEWKETMKEAIESTTNGVQKIAGLSGAKAAVANGASNIFKVSASAVKDLSGLAVVRKTSAVKKANSVYVYLTPEEHHDLGLTLPTGVFTPLVDLTDEDFISEIALEKAAAHEAKLIEEVNNELMTINHDNFITNFRGRVLDFLKGGSLTITKKIELERLLLVLHQRFTALFSILSIKTFEAEHVFSVVYKLAKIPFDERPYFFNAIFDQYENILLVSGKMGKAAAVVVQWVAGLKR